MGYLFERLDRSGWTPRRPSHRPVNTASIGLDLDVPPWMGQALCAQVDQEIFFPEKGGSTKQAKQVCTGCDVRLECLRYALDHDERYGIWGGLSERERRKVKKAEKAEKAAAS